MKIIINSPSVSLYSDVFTQLLTTGITLSIDKLQNSE